MFGYIITDENPTAMRMGMFVTLTVLYTKSVLSLSFDLTLFYFIILLLFIPSARCSDTFMERKREREDEFAFVYNICLCTWSSVHTCVCCRSMHVNVFVKL